MNVEQLMKMPIETLFVAFFNTVMNSDGNFEIYSSFRESKFLEMPENTHQLTAKQLSEKYGLDFILHGRTAIVTTVINDQNLNIDGFLNFVYENILLRLNHLPVNYPLDEEIALALFVMRGTVDFNRGLYAVDWQNVTDKYAENFFKLMLSSDDLLSRLNLNFRELQPQFVAGTNTRSTQIRINLKWYYDNVISRYGHINQYKTDILNSKITELGEVRKFPSFTERLIFYRAQVIGRDLSDTEINALRQELDFNEQIEVQKPDNVFNIRNQKIVAFARETFADTCVGCGDIYNIADRSFKMPRNDRYYFEVNHVIAYASDSNAVDVLDNLVKLCPTCHRALTPGRAYPDLQKSIISNMIRSRSEVEKFITTMMPHEYKSPVDYVFDSLK